MHRFTLFLCIILFIPVIGFSQDKLQIKGSGNSMYLEHTISPKENFYSVGRLYNVSPRELASFNHIKMENGLSIGQQLKIPLDLNNFTQSTVKSAAEALIPVYHTVASGETLFRIGTNYKNVPLSSLKKWNQLNSDQLNAGTDLIVGFIRVSKSESALAKTHAQKNNPPSTPIKEETAIVTAKEQPKPEMEIVKKESPESNGKHVEKEESKVEKNYVTPVQTISNPSAANSKEGFFKQQFADASANGQVSTMNVSASVFKSTSGWQDFKYYCFTDNAQPGSIIKISNPSLNTSVYAKVLDAVPDIKQNDGVGIVLSNAAADALGVTAEKFEASVTIVK